MDICIVSQRGRMYLHLLLLVYAKISACVGVLFLFLPFKKKKIIFKNASKQTTKVSFWTQTTQESKWIGFRPEDRHVI